MKAPGVNGSPDSPGASTTSAVDGASSSPDTAARPAVAVSLASPSFPTGRRRRGCAIADTRMRADVHEFWTLCTCGARFAATTPADLARAYGAHVGKGQLAKPLGVAYAPGKLA